MRIALLLAMLIALAAPRCGAGSGRGLSDEAFAALIDRLSGPGAHFDSDNWISNEWSYLDVNGQLGRLALPGGVYLGVGPSQNFTYLALTRPRVAFIVDIRRQNLIQHLVFKAIFERSEHPADFLSRLLGRPVSVSPDAPIEVIVAALDAAAPDPAYLAENLAYAQRQIRERWLVASTPEDAETAESIHRAFFEQGLDIHYEQERLAYFLRLIGMPRYRDLLLATDRTGRRANFLASREGFDFVKDLQARNLVVPVVGDLAGSIALNAIASHLEASGARVAVFYLSNVEYHVILAGGIGRLVRNLERLPHDENTLLVRSWLHVKAGEHPAARGRGSVTVVQRLDQTVRAFRAGNYGGYPDFIADYLPDEPGDSVSAGDGG